MQLTIVGFSIKDSFYLILISLVLILTVVDSNYLYLILLLVAFVYRVLYRKQGYLKISGFRVHSFRSE